MTPKSKAAGLKLHMNEFTYIQSWRVQSAGQVSVMGSTPVTHFPHREENNDHYLRRGLTLSTVHASMWQSHNSWSSGALERFQGPTCHFFFSPAEALGKIQTPLKSIIQAGGVLLSQVSDHATVTKVQTEDGSDSQRKNISLGGRSLMSSREY